VQRWFRTRLRKRLPTPAQYAWLPPESIKSIFDLFHRLVSSICFGLRESSEFASTNSEFIGAMEERPQDLTWASGNDTTIECLRYIASGEYGDVYAVHPFSEKVN
jgi:hypothetical protein